MRHTGLDGKAVAERLRQLMAEHGWNEEELAKNTGFGEATIAKWLRGESPKDFMLYPIIRRLGMTPESLLGPCQTKRMTIALDIHGRTSPEIRRTERVIESMFGPRPESLGPTPRTRSGFGCRLMKACRARGIDSQATLARRLGVTQPTVCRWMKIGGASTSSIGLICYILRVNRDWLCDGIGPMDALPETQPVHLGITPAELRRIRGERVPLLEPPSRSSPTVLNQRRIHPEQLKCRPEPVGVAA